MSEGDEISISKRDLHSHIHCDITVAKIRKQHKVRLMDEWIKHGVRVRDGISLSHKKEGNTAIYSNLNEPGGYHAK